MVSESEFKLYNIYLYNSTDNLIGTGRSSCEIQIIPLDEWVDGEYGELSEVYQSVSELYDELQSDYDDLNISFTELNTENQVLMSLNDELVSQISTIELTVEGLTIQIEELQDEIEELQRSQIPGFPYLSIVIGILVVFMIYTRVKDTI